jgi:hypothetical protein
MAGLSWQAPHLKTQNRNVENYILIFSKRQTASAINFASSRITHADATASSRSISIHLRISDRHRYSVFSGVGVFALSHVCSTMKVSVTRGDAQAVAHLSLNR